MARVTERVLSLLKVMHSGVPLRVLPKGRAMLDVTRIPPGIRRATVAKLESQGLIAHDTTDDRYHITDKGRDVVRLNDAVDLLEDADVDVRSLSTRQDS